MAKIKAKIDYQREAEKVLAYPTYYYQSFRLLDGDMLTPQDQRKELLRLLSVARKRQARLLQSEFAESYAARQKLPKMSELKSERQVSQALADVALMLRSRRSLVSGARAYEAEVQSTLKAHFADVHEVDFESESFSWRQFGRYMQDMKRRGKAKEGFDSDQAVRMFFLARGVGLTPAGLRDNYDKFLERQEELQALYNDNPYGRRNTSGAQMLERLDELSR